MEWLTAVLIGVIFALVAFIIWFVIMLGKGLERNH
jgi:hypothetical protein